MSTWSEDWDAVNAAELRARGSVKWSLEAPDGLGAWVAEMDFGTSPAVTEALVDVARSSRFGYLPDAVARDMSKATADFYADRYGWRIDPADVAPLPDVIKGLELAITEFSRPGAPVIVPTPAYMPFLFVPPSLGREVIPVPMLRREDGGYDLDLAGIEAAFDAGGDLVILANPGNPTGKVYAPGELRDLAALVARRGGRVFSDEIHAPLTLFGHRHTPFASVSDEAAAVAVTATSASKAWNLPGLKCAQLILSNDADRERWKTIGGMVSHGASTPGVIASIAAYRDGLPWLSEAIDYIEGNATWLRDKLAADLPEAVMTPLQGTYLAWLDLRAYPVDGEVGEFLWDHAHVKVNSGTAFGEAGTGFVRLNLATPRPVLAEIVARLAAALPAPAS